MPVAGRVAPTNTLQQMQNGARGLWTPPPIVLADELARREAARQRLIPFSQYIWPGFVSRPYRELLAATLEEVEAHRIQRLMVLLPQQWGKSTLVSEFFPPWYLGKHPDDNIILCSYNADLAANLSYKARQNMMEDNYKAIFGDLSPYVDPVEVSDRAAATKHWRLKSPYRGGLKSAGVGGGINGYGAALLLVDDPIKGAEDADSEKIRQSQIEWFKSDALGRLTPDGAIVIAMTRWHDMDLCGQLLKEQAEGGEKWHVLRLTAVAEDPLTIAEYCKRNNIDRDHYIVSARLPRRVAA